MRRELTFQWCGVSCLTKEDTRARLLNAESTWGLCFYATSDSINSVGDFVGGNTTRAFSYDLCSCVLAAPHDGMSARSVAAQLGIGVSTAIAWIANERQGQLTPAKQARRSGSRRATYEDFIIGMIEEKKDITLNEMVLCPAKAFSKLKAALHAKAERTVEDLRNTVGEIITLFAAQECAKPLRGIPVSNSTGHGSSPWIAHLTRASDNSHKDQ